MASVPRFPELPPLTASRPQNPPQQEQASKFDRQALLPRIIVVHTVQQVRRIKNELRILAMQTTPRAETPRNGQEDVLDAATFSRLAFLALLANDATFHSVQSFLRDPTLNLPGAKNVQTLLSHEWATRISKEAYDTLLEILKQAITAGSFLHTEVEQALPKLENMVSTLFKQFETKPALLRMYRALWEGLRDSRLKRVNHTLVRQLIKAVRALREDHEPATALMLDICKDTWCIPEQMIAKVPGYQPQWGWSDQLTRHASMGAFLAYWARCAHEKSVDGGWISPVCMDRGLLLQILGACPVDSFRKWVTNATRRLARQINDLSSDPYSWLQTLVFWLDCVRECPASRVVPQQLHKNNYTEMHTTLGQVYRLLSQALPMTTLVPIFKNLSPTEICHALINVWVPGLIRAAHGGHQELKSRFDAQRSKNKSRWDDETAEFAALVLAVKQTINPYDRKTQAEIFELVFELYGGPAFYHFMNICLDTQVKIFPTAMAAIFTRTDIIKDDPTLALKLWRLRRVYPSRYPQLVLSLIRNTSIHSARIFAMIDYGEPANSALCTQPLPPENPPENPLDQARIDLIHHMALAFAKRKSKSTGVALDDVFTSYRYLLKRRARLQPTLSRAFVIAGIMRPLREGRLVSRGTVRWIVGIVKKIEGTLIAEKLMRLTHRWQLQIQFNLQRRGLWKSDKDMPKTRNAPGVWVQHRRPGQTVHTYKFLHHWHKEHPSKAASREMEKELQGSGNGQQNSQLSTTSKRSWDWTQKHGNDALVPLVSAKGAINHDLQRSQTTTRKKEQRQTTASKASWDWPTEVLRMTELVKGEMSAGRLLKGNG